MSKRKKLLLALLSALLLLGGILMLTYVESTIRLRPSAVLHEQGDHGYIPVSAQPYSIDVATQQAFVYDVAREEILWQKGEERVVYPASTTKLLTALCVLELLDPDEVITVGEELELLDPDSSLAFVSRGQRLTVEMLIEGMLLPSGNDAAYVLAAAAGRVCDPEAPDAASAVNAFMSYVNTYAQAAGLCGTTFTTPDGLAYEEHYTTLEDLILIARLALKSEIIMKYTGLHEDSVVYESGETITWTNTNALLDPDSPYYRPSVTGLKTGSLARNYCLLCSVTKNGNTYIIGVFSAQSSADRWADACTIVDALIP